MLAICNFIILHYLYIQVPRLGSYVKCYFLFCIIIYSSKLLFYDGFTDYR